MSDDSSRRAAVLQALLQHDFSVYDGELNFKGSPSGRDILRDLRRSRTYLVDNNISWKALAQDHQDVNFVIGATVSEEANDLQGVLFSRMPTGGYANAFSVDLNVIGTPRVAFNRLDERYQAAVFARPIPTLENTPPEHRSQQQHAAASLRFQLVERLPRANEDLRQELRTHAARSQSSFFDAAATAMLGTVLMLKTLSTSRLRRKLDPTDVQLPGDTRLISEALFYGFPILSNDVRDVHTLGQIVGISVTTEAAFRAQAVGSAPVSVSAT